MGDTATMAAFGASERACYDYPGELQSPERAAFCAGAAWAAVEIERQDKRITELLTHNNELLARARVAERLLQYAYDSWARLIRE
jgi:hypothetical protein